MVGDQPCVVIPLHSTVAQIACKTTAPIPANGVEIATLTEDGRGHPGGWTERLAVRVWTGGVEAACASVDHWTCTFDMHDHQYHTPRIDSLSPRDVRPGTLLSVAGLFHWTPFSFDQIKAPSMEVPLSSVKIANRGAENQQGQNEPFGQSGTRCALFNAEVEEPFGISGGADADDAPHQPWVTGFTCKVNGPREAGRYNLSVALLGIAMVPDSRMYMGESRVAADVYQADHYGVTYMLQHVPVITGMSPNVTGTSGGVRITLTGDSFSNDKTLVSISIQGTPCVVETSSVQRIVCVLAPHVDVNASLLPTPAPAGRGLIAKLWYNVGAKKLADFKNDARFSDGPDKEWIEGSLFEMPQDIQNSRGDAVGPAGIFQGYFRPPVSGKVSFIVAADDWSEVHISRTAHGRAGAGPLEKIIDNDRWTYPRSWTTLLKSTGTENNPEDRLIRNRKRKSVPPSALADVADAQVEVEAGEHYFMEGFFSSGTGGDNFAVGAIFHNSTVNRKDRPTGVDEEQIIQADYPLMNLEVVNISLVSGGSLAGMGGTFKVVADGKESRPIAVNASALEVTAALRELFSNCRGSSGTVRDGAGSTFDCYQARSLEYRGLANTWFLNGVEQECARWDSHAFSWDPMLVREVGLTSNLCRNPRYNYGQPWCYASNGVTRDCEVPACGGDAPYKAAGGGAALVATFESESTSGSNNKDGLITFSSPYTGTVVRADDTTAFCGKQSMYVGNTVVDVRGIWREGQIDLKENPWICMASKIAPGSMIDLYMLIKRENEDGSFAGNQQAWKILHMTAHDSGYRVAGDFGVTDDNEWHHSCVNVYEGLDNLARNNDPDVTVGVHHTINYLRFTAAGNPYRKTPFWIDEFSIGPFKRVVTREPNPPYGGEVQVSSVKRVVSGSGVSFLVSLTTPTCDAPNVALSVDVSAASFVAAANASRAQEHSAKATGNLAVDFKGAQTSFSPYASAAEVRTALLALGSVGEDIKVERMGTCQAGYDWQVAFTHVPGDQPLFQVSTATVSDSAIMAVAVLVQDGGVLVAPLPADYFHVPGNVSVSAVVDHSTALCARSESADSDPSVCMVSFDKSLNPTISSVDRLDFASDAPGTFNLTVTGTNFARPFPDTEQALPGVTFGGAVCLDVFVASEEMITCRVQNPPLLAPGLYALEVVVPGRGQVVTALLEDFIEWNLTVTSVTPTSINANAPTVLTISGAGFHPILAENKFVFGDEPCAAQTVNATQVTCLYFAPTSPEGTRRRLLSAEGHSLSLTLESVALPEVTSVSPRSGSAGGGPPLTIVGTGFSTSLADVVVSVGGVEATVLTVSADEITVTSPAGAVGHVYVVVTIQGSGSSEATSAACFEYLLALTRVRPSSVGLAGGTRVTLEGQGFITADGRHGDPSVTLPGTEVYVAGLYTPVLQLPVENITGDWTLSLGGVTTSTFTSTSSEQAVLDGMAAAFPALSDVHVVSKDGAPGALLNRYYPRQWEIRFSRLEAAGSGIDRCTNPLYVDWAPDACPAAANDLFLAHYPWYWPAGLPKPGDLGEPHRKVALLKQCFLEAQSRNLRPGTCNALVPAETLAVCGQGSGVNPPCWEARFTNAAVLHLDGSRVIYQRDDSQAPTDFAKGLRFWTRSDFAERAASLKLSAAGTLAVIGGGSVHIQSLMKSTRGVEKVALSDVRVEDTSLSGVVPDLSPYVHQYSDLLLLEVLDAPTATIPIDAAFLTSSAPPGTFHTPSVLLAPPALLPYKTGAAGLTFRRAQPAKVEIPYNAAYNPPDRFSVSLWVLPGQDPSQDQGLEGGTEPIVSSLGPAGEGYALEISEDRKWRFRIGLVGGGESVLETPSRIPAPSGGWVHVAATWDGSKLRIFVAGQLAAESPAQEVVGTFLRNHNKPLVLGSAGVDGDWFDGSIDELVFYASAISPGRARAHASYANRQLLSQAGVSFGGATSSCTGTSCAFNPSVSLTPRVDAISPTRGWAGLTVTIFGGGFAPAETGAVVVTIGEDVCTPVSRTNSMIKCTVTGEPPAGQKVVRVFVAGVGVQIGDVTFDYTMDITSISPAAVSMEGGATISFSGSGIPTNASQRLEIRVGGVRCRIVGGPSSNRTSTSGASSDGNTTDDDDGDNTTATDGDNTTATGRRLLAEENSTTDDDNNSTSDDNSTDDNSTDAGDNETSSGNTNRGDGPCSATACQCIMDPRVSSDDETLRVEFFLDGVSVTCRNANAMSGECAVWARASVTPRISMLSPSTVSAGDSLTIWSDGEEFADGGEKPVVSIGEDECRVSRHNASQITCDVTQGEGGHSRVWVRFLDGYAAGGECCSRVLRPVEVVSVAPTSGSKFGGQRVTITGSGFSRVASQNRVTIGGRVARVESAGPAPTSQLVVISPALGASNATLADGVERQTYRDMLACITPGGGMGECVPWANLTGCAAGVFPGAATSWRKARHWVRAEPAGDDLGSRMGEVALIDGDFETVWRSSHGSDQARIAIDLGANTPIDTVVVQFGAKASAGTVRVRLGEGCGSLPAVRGNWSRSATNSPTAWDMVAEVHLEDGARGRYLILELEGRAAGQGGFEVRDVIAVAADDRSHERQTSVEVNGVASTCDGEWLCTMSQSLSPEIFSASPSAGFAGETLSLSGWGFHAENCSRNLVAVGSDVCEVQNCSARNINCTLAPLAAGNYPITLAILGRGEAFSQASFTYSLVISAISPDSIGFGGGLLVTISGFGFSDLSPDGVDAMDVTVCGAPCETVSSNYSQVTCTPASAVDVAEVKGIGGRDATQEIEITSGDDDASQDVATGAVSASADILGFSVVSGGSVYDDHSLEEVYLRFTGINAARGADFSLANLILKASDTFCSKGAVWLIHAEAADDSAPLRSDVRGSLTARPRTAKTVYWEQTDNWRWFGESQVSVDLTPLLEEVTQRDGWRAGNAITLILRGKQSGVNNWNNIRQGPFKQQCHFLSSEAGAAFTPRLRLTLALPASSAVTPALPASQGCDVTVSAKTVVAPASTDARACSARLLSVRATSSSSATGAGYKDVYAKRGISSGMAGEPAADWKWCAGEAGTCVCPAGTLAKFGVGTSWSERTIGDGGQIECSAPSFEDPIFGTAKACYCRLPGYAPTPLTWSAAREVCASHGMQLCGKDEVFSGPLSPAGKLRPFWETELDPPFFVPIRSNRWAWHKSQTYDWNHNAWLQISEKVGGAVDFPAWGATGNAENAARTSVTPCCNGAGHPAFMAVDVAADTYWESAEHEAAPALTLSLGGGGARVHRVEIEWKDAFHPEHFTLEARASPSGNWTRIHPRPPPQCAGCGNDVVTDVSPGSFGSNGVTISGVGANTVWREVRVQMRRYESVGSVKIREVRIDGCALGKASTSEVSEGLLTVTSALTPTVTSVMPSRGSTAGGTDITLRGNFFGASSVTVAFGAFDCAVSGSVTQLSGGESEVVCKTSASGVLHGGIKHVVVSAAGYGDSVPGGNATFWYVDTWSARTTWGGAAPPTGCGSWLDDPNCDDSVVIPEGQVVLLDVSLPRFYLILIQGKLIFDRADISIGASYLLLQGGTLQIGTEAEPFMQQAHITLFGHPKSIDLPVFGAKVIACYECTLDMHGAPQVAWTQLAQTSKPGDTSIKLLQAVTWPIGSKIVIATTDFESPQSSHSEISEVEAISESGTRVHVKDTRVCHEYTNSGLPKTCKHTPDGALTYPHLGEEIVLGGTLLAFRAEVGLLSRNIVVEGDYDARFCPLADLADDGVTRLSCNQFGAQIFLSSPGHESLVGRLSNMEIRNGGQAFRLGRYAIHWHMIGNVKESFQKNCSIHHSWNRGVAIHGVNFLRLEHNVAYHSMGHTFFIEDGVEMYNRLEGNLAIKTIPSMNLLNTDQTPACFWIVTGANYIINNHAAASRRYGFWFRPERSVTGTSVNTPMEVHPINIPVLEFRGNQAHSNGKYGLRIFDIFLPNDVSVFQDTFVWRNGKAGFTATVCGKVGFQGMVAVQNGLVVFEGRSTSVSAWDESYIRNALFVDYLPLPLAESYGIFEDSFEGVKPLGGPMEDGILLPWNEFAGGGMSISNVTFMNFKAPCIRGCAHCGRGGSPVMGDGAFETRFDGMTFINSSQRVFFRHPNEAYFHDLDGSLTGTGIKEDYTRGGSIRGASFVGSSVLRPPGCTPSNMSTHGTGGSICVGHIFRRMWYEPKTPVMWVGKALCIRTPEQTNINTCATMQPECNCLPYLKKAWRAHVWLVAEGERYNLAQDLQSHELADIVEFKMMLWDAGPMEHFQFSHRMLEWEAADNFYRPLYWSDYDGSGKNQIYPLNYNYNTTDCSAVGCGTLQPAPAWPTVDQDQRAVYVLGNGTQGDVPVPPANSDLWAYTVLPDQDGYGAVHTIHVRGKTSGWAHRETVVTIRPCPKNGCWPPPPAPPPPPPDDFFSKWSDGATWANLTGHAANPNNVLEEIELGRRKYDYKVRESQQWSRPIPSEFDNVWIPNWKKVILDMDTPMLGKLVIEGILVVNSTQAISLSAVYIEIKGGSMIIADLDSHGNIQGPFNGTATITVAGTNGKLAGIHGANPRENPGYTLGKEGLMMDAGMIAVTGTLIARGSPVGTSWVALGVTAQPGNASLDLAVEVAWEEGAEVVVTATDFNGHEAEVRRITGLSELPSGGTRVHLDAPLTYAHFSGVEFHGDAGRSVEMRAKVGILSRNVVFKGLGEGEERPYTEWNSAAAGAFALAGECGNGQCQNGEHSTNCPADCVGPTYEYGVSILVAGYTEEFVYCSQAEECERGFQRAFAGSVQLEDVEMRYHGQNNLRPALRFTYLDSDAPKSSVRNVAFNRGYSQGIELEGCSDVTIDGVIIFRAMLPAIRIEAVAERVLLNHTLVMSAIFWNTNRGALQSKGLGGYKKLTAMYGAVHSMSPTARITGNVVAGSERAGFSGKGVACGDTVHFQDNEVAASLNGYWWADIGRKGACHAITNLTAWKIWQYAVYAEISQVQVLEVVGLKAADAHVGVLVIMVAPGAGINHVYKQADAVVKDSIIIGRSKSNGACSDNKPGLSTCDFYMAWCGHLGRARVGVMIGGSIQGFNMAPLISPWVDHSVYPSPYGSLLIEDTTFARFEESACGAFAASPPQLRWARDTAFASLPASSKGADTSMPCTTRRLDLSEVTDAGLVLFVRTSPAWINQADCIDMDCDGLRHTLIRDEDGTLLGGPGGTVFGRSDIFSDNSFFGVPYKDGVNFPVPRDREWWYPNLPAVMRGTSTGQLVNLSATYLAGGYGVARSGCVLHDKWDAWVCRSTTSYRRVLIENVDADHEIRRVSPVAVTSDDGYTDLLNGAMDHGWCFSYTCLKRLMTFQSIMAVGKTYTVHFTGSNPQTLRLLMPDAEEGEKVLVRIYYQTKSRLQVFLGGEDFMEDLNFRDGKRKEQLVRDDKWASNDAAGGWTDEQASLDCASGCKVGDECRATSECSRRGDVHGANWYNKKEQMIEVVVSKHSTTQFVEIQTFPSVQVSVGLSVSVDEFYNIKNSFISNIANVLGINTANIAIVDVVAGNARRRQLLSDGTQDTTQGHDAGRRLLGDSVRVDFEVTPNAQLDIVDASDREDTGFMNVTVERSVNRFEACSVTWATSDGNGSATAEAGVDYTHATGTVHFAKNQMTAYLVIEVFSSAGYATLDKTLFVLLGTATNATSQDASALITLRNVHAPAPSPPTAPTATSASAISVTIAPLVWGAAPSTGDSTVLEYQGAARVPDSGVDSHTVSVSGTATAVAFPSLPTYSWWEVRLRARTANGWTAWSLPGAAVRTWSVCGDGLRHSDEDCDVGAAPDSASANGCIQCSATVGYACVGGSASVKDTCGAGCGDGGKNGIEECDDDANVNGDGCDASCRLETGWACASNEAGGLTSGCATTCGDGVKAGVEECDSGSDNSDTGHGCRADCTMAATAVCTENEAQLSTCRLCGNGKREAGETCDDSFSSGGCLLAGACQATTPGYLCSGGDLATADKCVSGPATAPAPVMSTATTSSLTFTWTAPDARGLVMARYELAWEAVSGVTSGNTSGVATGAGTTTLLKITSLAAAPAMYRAQVRGCTTAGCGTYSPWSPGAAITAKAATESLTAMASVITQDPKLLVTGLDVTVGNITSKAPEPEPVAPTSANDASVINETAILLANLPAPVVVVVPDPTTSTTPAATTTPAETSIVEEETTSTPAPVVETSIVEEETTSTPAPVVEVTTTPTAAVPTTPTVAVPTTTPVALPTTPTVALPTTPTVALPTTTPVALPTTTTPVAVPTTPTVAVPTTPTVAVPTTPAVAVTTAAVAATVVTPAATPAPIVYAPTVSPPVVVPQATTTTMVDATIETAVLLSSGAGVVIPAGSLMGNIAVSVTEVADPPAVPAAKAAEMTLSSKVLYFGPTGTTFTTPVKLVLSYTTPASAGLRLAVHRYNTVTLDWDEKPGSKVDAATSTVSVETNSFSSYGIFAVAPLPQETTPRPEGLPQWALLALTIGVPLVALLLIVLAIFALLRCCASPQTDSKVDTSHDAAGQLASRAGMHQVRVLGGDGGRVSAEMAFDSRASTPVTAAFPAEGHVPANGSGILYAGSANGSGILYGGYAQPSTAAVAFAITQGPSSPPLRAMAQRGSISLPPLSPRSALPATRMAAWKLPPLSQGLAPRGAATTSFQDVEVSASPSANLDPGYVAARPHGPLGGRPGQEWALSSITSSISHADARRLASGGGDEGGGVFSIPGSANQENPYTAANWHAQVIAHAQAQEARAQEQTPAQVQAHLQALSQAQDQAEAQYHAGVQAQYAAAPTQGHEAQAEARREPDPPPRAASRLADSSEALPENFFSGDAVWG